MTRETAEGVVATWKAAGHVTRYAAKAAGLPERTFAGRLAMALRMMGLERSAIVAATVPSGLALTKTTVQYDAQGNVIQEWRRLAPEAEGLEAVATRLCEQVSGKAPKLPAAPARAKDDLLLEVPIFDPHFGKYCWGQEVGADYNLDIARDGLVRCVRQLAARSGPCGRGLLVMGGDWFHSDTRHNQTERGGHALDVDTRQWKVWEAAADAIHASVATLAQACAEVHLVVIPGNHDWESSFHLSRLLAAFYRADPRVSVLASPKSRQYVRWGTVLLGFAHGHLVPMGDLASLMALEAKEDWAQTTERAWHQGHIHKGKALRTTSLDGQHSVTVEHIESLSGTDAWHHENGFVGMPRRQTAFVWHKRHGLLQRLYVHPEE